MHRHYVYLLCKHSGVFGNYAIHLISKVHFIALWVCLSPFEGRQSFEQKYPVRPVHLGYQLLFRTNCEPLQNNHTFTLAAIQERPLTSITLWVSGARQYTKNSYRDLTPDLRQKWWWKYMPLKLFSNPTSPFRVTSQLARPNLPFWLNWLGQLAGNSERARGIWK